MSAASALRYWERRQEVVANNLANVSTTGFKGERVFARAMANTLTMAGSITDRRPGTVENTGRPLDLALGNDETFLVLGTKTGERLSRGGSFSTDANGRLVDSDGSAVLGKEGPIVLPQGTVTIDDAGAVCVDGRAIAQLRLEHVSTNTPLRHEGGTRFVPPATRRPLDEFASGVQQGRLEQSNVSSVDSLVDLISIQRAYASTEKAISTLDDIRRTAATELGKPV